MGTHRWTVGFDADDTLWHNERGFQLTQTRFAQMLSGVVAKEDLMARLLAAEKRNLAIYGFGIKGFVLSMIETAIEVTDGKVTTDTIAELMALGRTMLADPVDLLPGVRSALEALRGQAHIVLITKGDLLDQERKLAQSGLGDLFDQVEIVSDKTVECYARIFADADTARCMMVGNSLRSDVIPAIEAGAWGVHIPHEFTWAYEVADPPLAHRRFRQIKSLTEVPGLISALT